MVERSFSAILAAVEPLHYRIAEVNKAHNSREAKALLSAGFGLKQYMEGAKDTYMAAMAAVSDSVVKKVAQLPQDAPDLLLGTIPQQVEKTMLGEIAQRTTTIVMGIQLAAERANITELEPTLTETLRQLSEIAHPGKGHRFRG